LRDHKEIQRTGLAGALVAWEALLGTSQVTRDPEALREASLATFSTTPRVLAILHPVTREEIQEVVRIANRFRIPLYPVSSGKNWGYGSRVPPQDGVLVDLGRMNRIVDFSEELAYVTIEPGVTQRQLHEFLRERGSRLWMDATGASPECSIIGNTMERGFGHTPMGDHCGTACGFEVVLPNGETLETGFSRFPGSKTGPLHRWGVGPSLDGLFSQSNFGIVTRMSVWLMPAPECFQAFFFLCHDEQGLGPIVDALRPLRLNETLRSVVHIGNDYKVLAATGQYPWGRTEGRVPLGRAIVDGIRRESSIGRWNGSGGLYGTRGQVREARSQLRRALAGKVDRLQFVDDRLLGFMQTCAKPFRLLTGWDVSRTLSVVAPVYNLLKGVPTDAPMASTYWRKKMRVPAHMNPDRDGCGLLWCSPVVPNRGQDIADVTQIATSTLLGCEFEPQISISLATARAAICVITISYDRAVHGEDERALRCYVALLERLLASGYPPYRLNVASMDRMRDDTSYGNALRALKASLDPNGILAPGRYEPAASAVESNDRAIGAA